MEKKMKRRNVRPKKRNIELDLENVKQFFPETSRMGIGLITPYEKQRRVRTSSAKKIPKLQLPRVAFYSARKTAGI